MIELLHVSGGYRRKKVLNDVSARIDNGIVTGIIGPNGCGKTTLLRAICGDAALTDGSIFVDGINASSLGTRTRALRVSRFMQDNTPVGITVRELAAMGRYPHVGFVGAMTAQDRAAVDNAIARAGAIEFQDETLDKLPGGWRQRAYLAMLFAQDTPNILLDEPAAHLDPRAGFDMMAVIRTLADEGRAVAAVMHDLPLAMRYCDVLIIMQNGEVARIGAPRECIDDIRRVFSVNIHTAPDGSFSVSPMYI